MYRNPLYYLCNFSVYLKIKFIKERSEGSEVWLVTEGESLRTRGRTQAIPVEPGLGTRQQ